MPNSSCALRLSTRVLPYLRGASAQQLQQLHACHLTATLPSGLSYDLPVGHVLSQLALELYVWQAEPLVDIFELTLLPQFAGKPAAFVAFVETLSWPEVRRMLSPDAMAPIGHPSGWDQVTWRCELN